MAELFSVNDKEILLKIVADEIDIDKEYICVKKKIAFKNMSNILYNNDLPNNILSLNGTEIKNAEKETDETKYYINIERMTCL